MQSFSLKKKKKRTAHGKIQIRFNEEFSPKNTDSWGRNLSLEKGAKCGFYVTVTQKSGNFSTEEGFPHLWLCLALESHGKRGLKFQQKPPKKGQNAKGLRGPSCQLDFPRDSSRQECPAPSREALESQPPTEPPQIPAGLGSRAQKAANSQISNPREEPLEPRRVRATGEK